MYARILVPLENSPADETILAHVRDLAHRLGASVVLVHVADGWVARNIKQLDLRESEEMRAAAEREGCDMIAMATHGHRLLEDVVKGSTATALRHATKIPILMVRAEKT